MHCIPKIPAYRIYIDAYTPTLINCMTLNGAENKLLPKMVYHSPLSNKPTHHALILMIWHPFVDILIFRTYQMNWVPKDSPKTSIINIEYIPKYRGFLPHFPQNAGHFPTLIKILPHIFHQWSSIPEFSMVSYHFLHFSIVFLCFPIVLPMVLPWLMAPWGTPAAAPAPPRHWPARHSRGHTPEPTRTGTLRRPGQIPQKPREKCGKIQWEFEIQWKFSGNVRENGWKFEMVISQEPIFMGGTGSIYFWPIFPAYVREYPNKIWPYMIQYLPF